MTARNITLSLPDELIRRAKVVAAQRDTSVSALVGTLLVRVLGEVEEYDRLWAEEEIVMAAGTLRLGERRSSRDELHQR